MKKDVLQPKNFVMLTIAGLINAFGVTCFLYPVNLYDSGISGTSMLLAQVTPGYLSLSVFLLLLNFPLFLYGYKKMGISFTLYSVYAVFVYSMGTWIITDILPVDVTIASPLAEQDLLLCAIFGGLISGIGSGLTIRYGGAIDGVEILAILFSKKLGITVGTFVMATMLFCMCLRALSWAVGSCRFTRSSHMRSRSRQWTLLRKVWIRRNPS